MKGGKKKEIVGYVRFGVSAEERDLIQRACAMDERNMADFARIYTMRAANALLGQNNGKNANEFIEEAKRSMMKMFETFENEAEDKQDKKKKQ